MEASSGRVNLPELAYHMAYAENPYRDLARYAIELGLHDAANSALELGAEAGERAGRAYLNEIAVTERDKEDPSIMLSVTLTEDDFKKFGQQNGYGGGMYVHAWHLLCRDMKTNPSAVDDVTMDSDGIGVVALRLTEERVATAMDLRGMGSAKRAFLADLFEAKLSEAPELYAP